MYSPFFEFMSFTSQKYRLLILRKTYRKQLALSIALITVLGIFVWINGLS
ncbi:MAG: hypothetical protein HWE14_13290 [Flavobacteriia bacterium]|nr:hypothetical protein [Flavobacteriia bacterium]